MDPSGIYQSGQSSSELRQCLCFELYSDIENPRQLTKYDCDDEIMEIAESVRDPGKLYGVIGNTKMGISNPFIDGEVHFFRYNNLYVSVLKLQFYIGPPQGINVYSRNQGLAKLVLRGNMFSHLAGAFDGVKIDEIDFVDGTFIRFYKEEDSIVHDVAAMLQNSEIAAIKLNWHLSTPTLLSKLSVIALTAEVSLLMEPIINNLKSVLTASSIAYLDLGENNLDDEDIENLSQSLVDSNLISLSLSKNNIGEDGARSLAQVLPRTKINFLHIEENKIGYAGFTCILENIEHTRIREISFSKNNIEEGLTEEIELSPYIVNREDTLVEFEIRDLFKDVVSSDKFEFNFPRNKDSVTKYPRLVKHFLETPNCNIHIYDMFYRKQQRHSINVLSKINAFKEQIKQHFFAFFENNLEELVEKFGHDIFLDLVMEFESLELKDFVEYLLLHRCLYYVDDEQNFLHPLIYKLLFLHKMPLYIEKLEPNKNQEIISYFEKHQYIEGAKDIINYVS